MTNKDGRSPSVVPSAILWRLARRASGALTKNLWDELRATASMGRIRAELHKLEAAGLVERDERTAYKRIIRWRATDEGRAVGNADAPTPSQPSPPSSPENPA